MTIFSEKAYDFIKYLCVIGLPAASTFVLGLGQIFGWAWCEPCSLVIILVQALFGTLFCVDVAGYNAELGSDDDETEETEDDVG